MVEAVLKAVAEQAVVEQAELVVVVIWVLQLVKL